MTEGFTLEKLQNAKKLLSGEVVEPEPCIIVSQSQKRWLDRQNRIRFRVIDYNMVNLTLRVVYPAQERLDSKEASYGVPHMLGGLIHEHYEKVEDDVASYFSGNVPSRIGKSSS